MKITDQYKTLQKYYNISVCQVIIRLEYQKLCLLRILKFIAVESISVQIWDRKGKESLTHD